MVKELILNDEKMSKTQKLLPLIEAEMRQPEMKERLQLQWIWSAAPQLKK